MSKKLPLSAKKIIKVLNKKFDFYVVSQKGSHIKLKKKDNGEKVTIVPNHKELSMETLDGILDLAKISKNEAVCPVFAIYL